MKKYRNTLLSLLFIQIGILFSTTSVAQEKKKVETVSFKVEGICMMCKERIENALSVKGVKKASWDKDSKICEVVYNTKKISEEELHKLLNEAGHDTERKTASKEQYSKIHACCRYREMESH